MKKNVFFSLLTALMVCGVFGVGTSSFAQSAGQGFGNLSDLAKKDSYTVTTLSATMDCGMDFGKVELGYPVFGRADLDQAIRVWAERWFAEEVAEFKTMCESAEEEEEWEQEQPSVEGKELTFNAEPTEVSATQGTVSIEFIISEYTGGAHGNYGVQTLTLDARGKILEYEDLFGTTNGLWKFLSDYAYTALRPEMQKNEIGDCWDPSMVRDGLTPTADTFSSFVVTPHGLTLTFALYQLAPYPCGLPVCSVPVEALGKFAPNPDVWTIAATRQQSMPSPASSMPSRLFSPSFNCDKASNAVERAICDDPGLSQLDVSVADAYKKALQATSDKEALKKEQRQWLQMTHRQCADADYQCLEKQYTERLLRLKQ